MAFIVLVGLIGHRSRASEANPPGYQRRGFYLHGSWVMNYPFSVRTWERDDFARMFRFLRIVGFDTVMLWPTPECAPMPLSPADALALRTYRAVLDDARTAGLASWLVYCPSVIAGEDVRSQPWAQRSLYASMRTIRLDDQPQATAYLEHRRAVLRILNNADAVVVIDGDPGGYPGAPVEEYLRILKNDQQAVPGTPVIHWIWGGWGRDGTKGGFWKQPVAPHVEATLAALKAGMSEPWELLPGRSHREGWANGRINLELVERAGLMDRSTLMCYEAIEFEPTPPAAVLQFDHIRRALREEAGFSRIARGVFGNAQQPVMVLPNLYFFARAAADLSYLDRPDRDVLSDLARALGGDPAVLIPAWSCLQAPLPDLPADLARRVRASTLTSELAACIPGGAAQYLEILAAQVESRRGLLQAIAGRPATAQAATESLAAAATALIRWWQVHRYVGPGRSGTAFRWSFIHASQVDLLRQYAAVCLEVEPNAAKLAAERVASAGLLPADEARLRLAELARKR